MAAELVDLLARATLVSSAAIILVLLLRGPLARLAGYRAVYACWLLVPVALASLALPGPSVQLDASQVAATEGFVPPVDGSLLANDSLIAGGIDASILLLAMWLLGVVLCAGMFLRQQYRFRRRVGRTRVRADGSFVSSTRLHGPVVIGLLRPRIIVPFDFDQRYDANERALILAHEAVHWQRGDLLANFVSIVLRCLFWFNPLLQFAAARFGKDQELACDAAVVARFPESRRRYADAMLKTQLAELGLPVGCAWQSSHPMRERIAMLNKPVPSALRSKIAATALVVMSFGCAAAVWGAQPPEIETIELPANSGATAQLAGLSAKTGQDTQLDPAAANSPSAALLQNAASKQGRAAVPIWLQQIPGAASAQAAYTAELNPEGC